jgi:FMN-dependent NADH-azoreductase
MSQLLHIDTSVRGDASMSRRLTARAAVRWRAAHPGATVTYRDLGANPIQHLDAATGLARMVTAAQRTEAEDASLALSVEFDEIKQADTVLLGLPLYNFGPPSTVKAWVDHIIAPGLSIDAETHAGPSATPTSPCLPAAAAVTARARRAKAGIMPKPGCRMPCR